MKLIFLGSGSAFTVGADNYHSNMILENDEGERLLIDCGSDVRWSLYERELTYRDIKSVYISHLHADHVGGLEWLAVTTFFDPTCPKPNLYLSNYLIEDLWEKVLSGGLNTLEDRVASLSTYFNVIPINEGCSLSWGGMEIQLVKTVHVLSDHHYLPSYGLLFNVKGYKVFITTDTLCLVEEMKGIFQSADLIFHDCETAEVPSHVHAHYEELKILDSSLKEKMWLYHYNPGPLPDSEKDGFRGFVKKGQVFDFDEGKR